MNKIAFFCDIISYFKIHTFWTCIFFQKKKYWSLNYFFSCFVFFFLTIYIIQRVSLFPLWWLSNGATKNGLLCGPPSKSDNVLPFIVDSLEGDAPSICKSSLTLWPKLLRAVSHHSFVFPIFETLYPKRTWNPRLISSNSASKCSNWSQKINNRRYWWLSLSENRWKEVWEGL